MAKSNDAADENGTPGPVAESVAISTEGTVEAEDEDEDEDEENVYVDADLINADDSSMMLPFTLVEGGSGPRMDGAPPSDAAKSEPGNRRRRSLIGSVEAPPSLTSLDGTTAMPYVQRKSVTRQSLISPAGREGMRLPGTSTTLERCAKEVEEATAQLQNYASATRSKEEHGW